MTELPSARQPAFTLAAVDNDAQPGAGSGEIRFVECKA